MTLSSAKVLFFSDIAKIFVKILHFPFLSTSSRIDSSYMRISERTLSFSCLQRYCFSVIITKKIPKSINKSKNVCECSIVHSEVP